MIEHLNLTPGAIVIMLLSIIIVEGGRLVSRARNNPIKRQRLSIKVWMSDWVNWATLVLNLLTCLVLLSVRESIAEFGGMEIGNAERFDLFFAALIGSGSQGLWKIVLKAGDSLVARKQSGGI
jgi:hypothetical protein